MSKVFSGPFKGMVIRDGFSYVYSILGDQHDIDRAKHLGIDAMSSDDLKKLNKNKKLCVDTFTRFAITYSFADTRVQHQKARSQIRCLYRFRRFDQAGNFSRGCNCKNKLTAC